MSGEAALAGSSSRYLKSDEDEGNTLVYANNPECFSEEFLTFMGLDAVLAMKAEAQKQEALKKQERAQKQEGTPKQEGTQKQKLLAQSQKVKGWMEEDESPRDAAYLDQAPEFPSCTYSVGFKTVKKSWRSSSARPVECSCDFQTIGIACFLRRKLKNSAWFQFFLYFCSRRTQKQLFKNHFIKSWKS